MSWCVLSICHITFQSHRSLKTGADFFFQTSFRGYRNDRQTTQWCAAVCSPAPTVMSNDSESASGGILQNQDVVLRNTNLNFIFCGTLCSLSWELWTISFGLNFFSVFQVFAGFFFSPESKEWYMENEIIEKHLWRAYGEVNFSWGEAETCVALLSWRKTDSWVMLWFGL